MNEPAVPEGFESMALRRGGSVGLGDAQLIIDRESDDPIRVEYGNIVEVTRQDTDWFLTVLSVVLIGFGVVSVPRNAVIGGGFAAAGVVSLYLTYRKRGEITIRVTGRARPLTLYPEDATELYQRLEVLAVEES